MGFGHKAAMMSDRKVGHEDEQRSCKRIPSRSRSLLKQAISTRTISLLQSSALSSSGSLSLVHDNNGNRTVEKLKHEDVIVGKLVGTGGFNHVCEVTDIRHTSFLKDDEHTDEQAEGSKGKKFVIKHLSPAVMRDKEQFRAASVDLVREAKLLASINHQSIVKLHGVTKGCAASAFFSDDEAGYFLVLDKLECTLQERIKEWCDKEKIIKKGSMGLFNAAKVNMLIHESLCQRLDVANQVAEGMKYLHSRNIIYRDLKPANIGFDSRHKVKIFDFGLSKQLLPEDERRPTGYAGTPRYMAPEVARCTNYGFSADVYSFGILLWEICALKRPYRKYSMRKLQDKVAYGTKRPKLNSKWPLWIQNMMKQCWLVDPSERLGFDEILEVLYEELSKDKSEKIC